MTATLPRERAAETSDVERRAFLGLTALRGALALVAIPLAPALYRDHVGILVFLRPTKEVFLFAGYQISEGNTNVPSVVAAAVLLLVGGVWVFYGLGRAYAAALTDDDLPGIAGRLLPRKRVEQMQEVLEARGVPVVFFGRLAAFPSTLMAAAAGASEMDWKRFAVADGAGALVSLGLLVGAGVLLQETYESAGPWFTAGGAVVLLGLVIAFGRWISRTPAGRPREAHDGAS